MTGFERQWKGRFEKFATRHEPDHLVSGWSAAGLRRRMATFEGLLDGASLGKARVDREVVARWQRAHRDEGHDSDKAL